MAIPGVLGACPTRLSCGDMSIKARGGVGAQKRNTLSDRSNCSKRPLLKVMLQSLTVIVTLWRNVRECPCTDMLKSTAFGLPGKSSGSSKPESLRPRCNHQSKLYNRYALHLPTAFTSLRSGVAFVWICHGSELWLGEAASRAAPPINAFTR